MAIAKTPKNLASFRAAHDKNVIIPNKIRAAIASLEKDHGPEGWEYEAEFSKRAGTSTTDFAMFREEFKDHFVEVGGRNAKRVWFATVKAAKAARAA
jgi:hypothetical protein